MIELAREQGKNPEDFPKVRKALAAAAEFSVPESLLSVWDAFAVLSRSRAYGMNAPQRIAFVDIAACVGMLDIPQPLRFVRLIQAMDDVYLNAFIEKRPKHGSRTAGSKN